MADLDKVIKGLKYCTHTDGVECPNCPYWQDDDCIEALNADAIALLKEQDAVIYDLRNQVAMLMGAQHAMCEMMKEQECAKIKEPDCRICGQSHCKYYHESRKPTECKSYVRMEGR